MSATFPATAAVQLTPFGHALAGALGAVFANTVVYPLDIVKTRIQAADDKDVKGKGKGPAKKLSAWELLVKIAREEGIGGYWAGYGASTLSTFSQSYAYFLAYSFVRTSYLRRLARKLPAGATLPSISTAMELVLGAVAGALAQIFTIPVSVIATRQQIGSNSLPTPGGDKEDTSFLGVAKDIVREDGLQGLWTGLRPGLVLTVNPAITYGMYERIKGLLLLSARMTEHGKLRPLVAFLLGALSKTLATVVTYPYIMAKVRLQAKPHGDVDELAASSIPLTAENTGPGTSAPTFAEVATESPPVEIKEKAARINKRSAKYSGAIDLLQKVLKQEGFAGWYRGMGTQITKAVLCQSLLFMMKDQFEGHALFIMLILRRITGRAQALKV